MKKEEIKLIDEGIRPKPVDKKRQKEINAMLKKMGLK